MYVGDERCYFCDRMGRVVPRNSNFKFCDKHWRLLQELWQDEWLATRSQEALHSLLASAPNNASDSAHLSAVLERVRDRLNCQEGDR